MSKQSKFPLRTHPMNEELLKYCNEFFPEYDFVFMLFHQVIAMFMIVIALKLVVPHEYLNTNLCLYIAGFTLMSTCQNLCRNAFPTGYFSFTDETKVQLLFSIKSFIMVWGFFTYTEGSLE